MMIARTSFFVALIALFLPSAASAYVGPGLGVGGLIVVFGILATLIVALFSVFYLPLRKLYIAVTRRKVVESTQPAKSQLNDETSGEK